MLNSLESMEVFLQHERLDHDVAAIDRRGVPFGVHFFAAEYCIGWHIGFKGAEVPADIRATLSYLIVAAICAAVVYFSERRGKAQKNRPD